MNQVFKTPPIPQWIKDLRSVGYTNVFELHLGNRNLFGTETLLGDWDGVVLVVAKDFAPVEEVKRLIESGCPSSKVYRHNDGDGRYDTGLRTNQRLLRFMYGDTSNRMLDGRCNTKCGALYVNGCFFLKRGDEKSSSLTAWRTGGEAFEKSKEVLKFVIGNMRNLRAIAALGNEPHAILEALFNSDSRLKRDMLFKHAHPSRGANIAHDQTWQEMMRQASIVRDNTTLH